MARRDWCSWQCGEDAVRIESRFEGVHDPAQVRIVIAQRGNITFRNSSQDNERSASGDSVLMQSSNGRVLVGGRSIDTDQEDSQRGPADRRPLAPGSEAIQYFQLARNICWQHAKLRDQSR